MVVKFFTMATSLIAGRDTKSLDGMREKTNLSRTRSWWRHHIAHFCKGARRFVLVASLFIFFVVDRRMRNVRPKYDIVFFHVLFFGHTTSVIHRAICVFAKMAVKAFRQSVLRLIVSELAFFVVVGIRNSTRLCALEVSGSESWVRVETLGALHNVLVTLSAHRGRSGWILNGWLFCKIINFIFISPDLIFM